MHGATCRRWLASCLTTEAVAVMLTAPKAVARPAAPVAKKAEGA